MATSTVRIKIEDESSSNDELEVEDEDPTQYYSKRPDVNMFEIDHESDTNYTQNASIGQPKRALYIWLRLIVISFYVVVSISVIYMMMNNDISDVFIDSMIITTIFIPTVLLFIVFARPQCASFTSCIILGIVVILRTIQWIIAIIYVMCASDIVGIDYLFAILGALVNECGFLYILLKDYYVFYIIKDYDNAILSIHYNPQKAVRLVSIMLLISSILWFMHCYHISHSSDSEFIDAWFYLLLVIITTLFLVFEYILAAKWGNKLGFVLCCVVMLLFLFIWGDDNLLSFSDIATAAILPQIFTLSFAYWKKFATECTQTTH